MAYSIIALTTIFLGSMSCCLSADEQPATPKTETKMILPESDTKPIAKETGLARDLRLLRKTVTLPTKPAIQASSGDAIRAATRIFARLSFTGMSKEHVLWILGDPETISDYGVKVKPGVDTPLIYRIDCGRGGYEYRLKFKDGRVAQVQELGID